VSVGSTAETTRDATSPSGRQSSRGSDDVRGDIPRFVSLILDRGLADLGASLLLPQSVVQRAAQARGEVWVSELLNRIPPLQAALQHRSAGDVRALLLATFASLLARNRYQEHFTDREPPHPIAAVLGTDEKSKSDIAQLRLIGGGASVSPNAGGGCDVRIVLADPSSSTLLVALKTFRSVVDPTAVPTVGTNNHVASGPALTGPMVANRSLVKGATLVAAATGSLVSNGAVRRPNRSVEFRVSGLRQTSAVAGNATINRFRDGGLVTTPSAFLAAADTRAPRLLRSLVLTEDLIVISIDEICHAGFDPAEQSVRVAARAGDDQFLIESKYTDVSPGAPCALAEFAALSAENPAGSFVVGHAKATLDGLVLVPTLLGSGALTAPALVDPSAVQLEALKQLPIIGGAPNHPISEVVRVVSDLLSSLLVDGTRDSARWVSRAGVVRKQLDQGGLSGMAYALEGLVHVVNEAGQNRDGNREPNLLVDRWADLAFMALTAADSTT
jgi:hypothetical protein